MKVRSKWVITFGLLILGIFSMQCTETGSDPVGPNQNNTQIVDSTMAKATLAAGAGVYQSASEAMAAVYDAVYFASVSSGSQTAVVTGSVQQQPGTQGWTYSSQPQDRLRLILNTGETFEYFVSVIIGDFSGSAQNFVARNHTLNVRVTGADQLDVTIISNSAGGSRQATIAGTVSWQGGVYQTNLTVNGTYYFDVDNTGSEIRVEDRYQGTISGDGFSATIDESWTYNSVYSSGLRRENAYAIRTINNSWDVNGVRFELRNGQFKTAFQDGKPDDWAPPQQYWYAQGELFRDNVSIGGLQWGARAGRLIHWLFIDNLQIELQSWLAS